MTKREFLEAVMAGKVAEAEMAFAKALVEKMDATNAQRAQKQGEKAKEAYTPFMEKFVEALGEKPMTATMLMPAFEGMVTPKGTEPTVQFVSAVGRKVVEAGLADKVEVKVKGKGKQVGYVLAGATVDGTEESDAE